MIDKNLLASTLRDLATLVETSDDREYAVLLEIGVGEIIRRPRASKRINTKRTRPDSANREVESAIASLALVASRESGFEILDRLELNRLELEKVARRLDLHVMREDNSHRLKEKIVERSVGSRLNSMAIRGE